MLALCAMGLPDALLLSPQAECQPLGQALSAGVLRCALTWLPHMGATPGAVQLGASMLKRAAALCMQSPHAMAVMTAGSSWSTVIWGAWTAPSQMVALQIW